MTSKEALKIAKENKITRDKTPISCVEYPSYFVFDFRKDPKEKVFDSLVGVNKKTKKVVAFMPVMISREEFKQGKKVSF